MAPAKKQSEIIYLRDPSKTYVNIIVKNKHTSFTNVYIDKENKTVLTESRNSVMNGNNVETNFVTLLKMSNIQVQNLKNLNGNYMSTYIANDDFIDSIQTNLDVHYIGLDNKNRLKVTYLENFSKVTIQKV